jgi:hypothetical protein
MTEQHYVDPALAGRWDPAILEPLADINEEIVEALAGTGARGHGAPATGGLAWHWQALGSPARRRLARCPYLLLDAGFARSEFWAALPRAGVSDATTGSDPAGRGARLATPLLRRVLLFSWHLARSNRLAARLALGMSGGCAGVLAGWRLADLELLAEQRPAWIRPRWDERPDIWLAWLAAAAQEQPRALERLQHRGLQMLAAEVAACQVHDAHTPVGKLR